MLPLATHLVYLMISIALTVWVARTLSQNGLAFLRDSFAGNEALASSVNHLLVVGFYLFNLGLVLLSLTRGGAPHDITKALEILSVRVGWVLLILGGMHLLNIYLIGRWRQRAVSERQQVESELRRRQALNREVTL